MLRLEASTFFAEGDKRCFRFRRSPAGRSSITYVRPENQDKPKSQSFAVLRIGGSSLERLQVAGRRRAVASR
jgi:hypothetical protein